MPNEPEAQVSLVEVLKDPDRCDYEVEELDPNGHKYLYHYDGEKGVFLRATVPSGAASPVLLPLSRHDKVPIYGWVRVEEGKKRYGPLGLVKKCF